MRYRDFMIEILNYGDLKIIDKLLERTQKGYSEHQKVVDEILLDVKLNKNKALLFDSLCPRTL